MGGWVGYRKIEEIEAVGMRCWKLWMVGVGGWVGGWVGGGGGDVPVPGKPAM